MKLLGVAVLALSFALGAGQAIAAKYTLTIVNGYSNLNPVLKVRVQGGEMLEQPAKTWPQPREVSLPVELGGACYTRVSLWFESGVRSDVMVDICSEQGILVD